MFILFQSFKNVNGYFLLQSDGMVENATGQSVRQYASENPIHYAQPEPTYVPLPVRRHSPQREHSPISFPMVLGAITPEVSKLMDEVSVARSSSLTPIAEEGSPAA